MTVPHRPMTVQELQAMTSAERRASLEETIIFNPESDVRMTPGLRSLWVRSGERAVLRARELDL